MTRPYRFSTCPMRSPMATARSCSGASDVIATGDIYNSDIYPPIDVRRGGSIDGEIEALNRVLDMSVTEYMSQGGTMIVPGHGWISDSADMGYYRDMLMIIRDRIQSLIDKGMTLEQVKAAKPTMDYDPRVWKTSRSDGSICRGRLRQSEAKEDEIVLQKHQGDSHAHSVFFVVDCGNDRRRKSDGRSPPLLYRSLQCRQNDNDKRKNHPDRASFSSLLLLCRVAGRRMAPQQWAIEGASAGQFAQQGVDANCVSRGRPRGSDRQPVAHPKQHSGAAGEDRSDVRMANRGGHVLQKPSSSEPGSSRPIASAIVACACVSDPAMMQAQGERRQRAAASDGEGFGSNRSHRLLDRSSDRRLARAHVHCSQRGLRQWSARRQSPWSAPVGSVSAPTPRRTATFPTT